MSWERDELASIISTNRSTWVTNSEHAAMEQAQAEAIINAGYRKIFDGDCGLTGLHEDDREAAEAWMRWANLVNIPEDGNGIAAMKQMLAEFGYKRVTQ